MLLVVVLLVFIIILLLLKYVSLNNLFIKTSREQLDSIDTLKEEISSLDNQKQILNNQINIYDVEISNLKNNITE